MSGPILDTAILDLAKARARLEEAKTRATRPHLRAEWAEVALRLARTLIVTDVATARRMLEEVRRVALAHPDEPLARAWIDVVSSVIVPHLAAVDVDAAVSMLDLWEELVRSQPLEPRLIEQWVSGVKTVIARLAVTDPARARSLQIKLEAVRGAP